MEPKKCGYKPSFGEGFTIGMAYVPWQHWRKVYSPEEGLKCGTIFPELNKPFLGKGGCKR